MVFRSRYSMSSEQLFFRVTYPKVPIYLLPGSFFLPLRHAHRKTWWTVLVLAQPSANRQSRRSLNYFATTNLRSLLFQRSSQFGERSTVAQQISIPKQCRASGRPRETSIFQFAARKKPNDLFSLQKPISAFF